MRLRLTRLADRDLGSVIRASRVGFGDGQARSYAALIRSTLLQLADEPERLTARLRPEFGSGVRSLHLSVAARRRRSARHIIYYRAGESEVVVLRILHDSMEPMHRLANAMREEGLKRSSPRRPRRSPDR